MRELERIYDLVGRAGSYASLWFSTDTADPVRGALLQRVQERATEIETKLLFFELEWAAVDDARADELLAEPAADAPDPLAFCRHYLRSARRYRPHLLTEPEEKVLAEKSISSQQRLGSPVWRARRRRCESASTTSRSRSRSRSAACSSLIARHAQVAAEAVTGALEPGLRTRAFIYNTLVYDKSVDDRLRHYPHWLASRNLANEASDESVMALIEAVRDRYDIPRRWYTLKARAARGLAKLADYDRMAPVAPARRSTFSFGEARELVLDTYQSFSPEAGRVTRRFFDERWIDAPVRPNKRGGAFCSYTVPSVHPYVMLNFTARRRDVLTMAHELGHGLHAALAQPQGAFHQGTPLTLAETASVFGETLVFERLLDDGRQRRPAPEPARRTARRGDRDRVPPDVDEPLRAPGAHPPPRRGRALRPTGSASCGSRARPSCSATRSRSPTATGCGGPTSRTSSTPPATCTPTPTDSCWRCRPTGATPHEGESFVPRYLELLAAGGSRSPEELGAIIGIDLADPGFWDSGLALIEEQLSAAEKLAERRGLARRVRERSSWRSTTLTISFSTWSMPVALASPCTNASRQSADVALGGQLVELRALHGQV